MAVLQKGNGLHWFLGATNCYWSIRVRGALSDDHLIQLNVVTGTLNAQKYQDQILESGARSHLDLLVGLNMVLRDDIARPHCTRIIEEYKNQQNIASLPRSSLLPDLNPIKHVWYKLGWRVWNREPAVSKSLWILLDSTASVGQDFMSWTHVPSEFNDENVPSCYLTVWRLYTTQTGSSGLLWAILWLFAPDPESVCSKENVLKKLHLSRTYCKSYADSWPPCCFHWILLNLWLIFVRCLQPINKSEISQLFFIKSLVFCSCCPPQYIFGISQSFRSKTYRF